MLWVFLRVVFVEWTPSHLLPFVFNCEQRVDRWPWLENKGTIRGKLGRKAIVCLRLAASSKGEKIEKISQRTEKKLKSTSIKHEVNQPPVVAPEPFLVNHCCRERQGNPSNAN